MTGAPIGTPVLFDKIAKKVLPKRKNYATIIFA